MADLDDIAARIDETNRLLAATALRLDLMGKQVGTALNAAAVSGRRAKRPRPFSDPDLWRFGRTAGRSRDEVVNILNRHGHSLTA